MTSVASRPHPTTARPRTAARRSGLRVLAGALITVSAAVGFAVWQISADRSQPVLVVARPVPAGQVIVLEDLRTAQVSSETGVDTILAAQAAEVVGHTAAVPLTPGSLLGVGQIGPPKFPAAGQAVVAVSVKQPPAGLTAGSRVTVLITPAQASNDQQPALLTEPASATVVQVTAAGDGTAAMLVSLLLPADAGQRVAIAASTGTVSLVVTPAG